MRNLRGSPTPDGATPTEAPGTSWDFGPRPGPPGPSRPLQDGILGMISPPADEECLDLVWLAGSRWMTGLSLETENASWLSFQR